MLDQSAGQGLGRQKSDCEGNNDDESDDSDGFAARLQAEELAVGCMVVRTGIGSGTAEAHFWTDAAGVKFGSPNVPVITKYQQQLEWSGGRPIDELFRRMEDVNRTVSVQIPSRNSALESFESRKLTEIQARFLENSGTDDPLNILDLRSPLPPSILPNFLTGENCQLLPRIRDAVVVKVATKRMRKSC